MQYKFINLDLSDAVAVVTLTEPAALNPIGPEMATELKHVFAALAAGQVAARAIVLTGAGRAFCSGAKLAADRSIGVIDVDGKPDVGHDLEVLYNPLIRQMRDLNLPLVTAVNGVAAGVGCSLALLGDLIVAGESASFIQAFRRIGLVPDGGSTYMLPRSVGRARAMEMMLLGEKLSAARALQWGLINRCVRDSELMPTAMTLARDLASGPQSLAIIRRLLWEGLDASWGEQLHNERMAQKEAGKTEDYVEGFASFLEKRPPVFKGS